jgi:predicted dehydrogenase
MTRIGMIGCGHIGTVHAYSLAQLSAAGLIDGALHAVYDDDPARAAKLAHHNGGTPRDSLDAVLDDVDVVWICTWTDGHLPAVRAAVERGLPVFCEKPLAPTLADCEAVAELLVQVPHQVGLVLRWAPAFATIAEAVQRGEHGAVQAVILRDDQYFPVQGMYGSTWRGDVARAGGGTLIEHSIHDLDVLRWILGDPTDVAGRTTNRFGYEGIEDIATVTMTYPNGAQASLVSVWHQVLSRGSGRRLEVFCEGAYLHTADDYLGPVTIETSEAVTEVTGEPPEWAGRLTVPEVYQKAIAAYAAPNKAFLDGLAAPGGPMSGHPEVAEALAAHRIVDLAYRSAAAGGAPLAYGSSEPGR